MALAQIAQIAILLKINKISGFNNLISNKELYKYFHSGVSQDTIINDYVQYKEEIKDVFANRWKATEDRWIGPDRYVDRALWTYRHLFNDIASNRRRV